MIGFLEFNVKRKRMQGVPEALSRYKKMHRPSRKIFAADGTFRRPFRGVKGAHAYVIPHRENVLFYRWSCCPRSEPAR